MRAAVPARRQRPLLAGICASLLASCASFSAPSPLTDSVPAASAPASAPTPAAPATAAASTTAAASPDVIVTSPAASATLPLSGALETMRELRAAAKAAFDTNHPSEALRHLVGILAVDGEEPAEADFDRSSERRELARWADAELTRVGARLTLEPADEWVVDNVQISGKLQDPAKGASLFPAVRLVINYDFGKAVVADAPIRFGVIAGMGEVTDRSITDSYGLASATILSVSRTDLPLTIRAMLVVANRGTTRVFPEVSRDFTYLPQSRTARILARERASSGTEELVHDSSPLVDAVVRGLTGAAFSFLPSEDIGDGADFEAVKAGDAASIAKIADSASYLVIAVTEYDEPRQIVNNGRAFNIYTAAARTNFRILRSDGTLAATIPVLNNIGRGGTPAAAVQAAIAASRSDLERELRDSAAEISKALD